MPLGLEKKALHLLEKNCAVEKNKTSPPKKMSPKIFNPEAFKNFWTCPIHVTLRCGNHIHHTFSRSGSSIAAKLDYSTRGFTFRAFQTGFHTLTALPSMILLMEKIPRTTTWDV